MDSLNVDQFIRDEIDSVPHLEALLLLWRNAPRQYSASDLAHQLYIPPSHAQAIADDLTRRGLIARAGDETSAFFYDTASDPRNRLLQRVDETYRRDLIRISGIIHSKASPGIRAFAHAFRFRKEKH